VIRVTNRKLGSLIEQTERENMVTDAYDTWLTDRAADLNARTYLDDEMREWALTEALQ
jgi:hypothetical protein